MEARPDISPELVHFTSGTTSEEAFGRLWEITTTRRLLGSGEKIRGGYRCVCFTEAPVRSLQNGLVNPGSYSRYSPFGILVSKDWLFAQGGRPVIYQSEPEFELLPEGLRWRHVRYEPGVVDFTWEREWRIQCDELRINPASAEIVVPTKEWRERLVAQHQVSQEDRIHRYSQVMDENLAEQYREPFPWTVHASKTVRA